MVQQFLKTYRCFTRTEIAEKVQSSNWGNRYKNAKFKEILLFRNGLMRQSQKAYADVIYLSGNQ